MDTPSKDKFKRVMAFLPLVLLGFVACLFPPAGLLLIIYSIVMGVAWGSALPFFIVFGGALLIAGAGVGAAEGFWQYRNSYRKKYEPEISGDAEESSAAKFFGQPSSSIGSVKKKKLTIGGIALIMLVVGSVSILVSAALGALDREKWLAAKKDYMEDNGYLAEAERRTLEYSISKHDLSGIEVDLKDKNAVVIYEPTELSERVRVEAYFLYDNQIAISVGNGVLRLTEMPRPPADDPADKMLFFLFSESKVERQIKIYIPLAYKPDIEVDKDCIIAKN